MEPTLFPKNAPECAVLDNNNMAKSQCLFNGSLVLMGQGAGGDPTASNVMRDLVLIKSGLKNFLPESCEEGKANNAGGCPRYYVRLDARDTDLFPAAETEMDGNICRIITSPMAVSRAHDAAKAIRAAGRKVFFAALAE